LTKNVVCGENYSPMMGIKKTFVIFFCYKMLWIFFNKYCRQWW